jgi:dTMP kinase
MKNHLFIAFEGIDGSGKSTQASILAERLKSEGKSVYLTNEPSQGNIGRMIRTILKGEETFDERAIAALFAADRLDHILNEKDGMLKKLETEIVICDRYYFSSYAYHGTHINMDWVISTNAMSAEILRPDITIFIDVAPQESMKRITVNRESIELYETLDNLTAVRTKYFEAFEKLKEDENVVIIDGNREKGDVSQAIWGVVKKVMQEE